MLYYFFLFLLCQCLDGHVEEPYEMSMALGARPYIFVGLTSSARLHTHLPSHI